MVMQWQLRVLGLAVQCCKLPALVQGPPGENEMGKSKDEERSGWHLTCLFIDFWF